jgi:hypothetical protein
MHDGILHATDSVYIVHVAGNIALSTVGIHSQNVYSLRPFVVAEQGSKLSFETKLYLC